MKRLFIIFTVVLFYTAACTNSDTHSHNGEPHTRDEAGHTHENGADHTHEAGADHDHPHEQEEFTIESDTLRQDSVNHQE